MRSSRPTGHPLRIGIVSTRLESTDGVSLESQKWSEVFRRLGHQCYYFAGSSDRPAELTHLVPEAHFAHPDIRRVYDQAFGASLRSPELTASIQHLADHLKVQLALFIKRFSIQVLVTENSLAIPLNIPLGVALTQLIAEIGIPTIAHHHDLYWERPRFLVNCVADYLDMSFPPRLPSILHVTINSAAAAQLSYRRGVTAFLVPNVMDFEGVRPELDDYASSLRADVGVRPGESVLLQPTRVVPRKAIEHSIELARRLSLPACLVISHASGDEGPEYETYLREFARLLNERTIFVSEIIKNYRGTRADGRKVYALSDAYLCADMVTYPSLIEGFGNAFLEAVYFRRPIVVNDYTIYAMDIKPKGFRAIELPGFVSDTVVAEVERLLTSPAASAEMVEHNFQLGRRFYSFSALERQLAGLVSSITGE